MKLKSPGTRNRPLIRFALAVFGSILFFTGAAASREDEDLLAKANRLAQENKLEKAAAAFLAASRAGESPVEALLGLGAVYYRMEEYEDAARTAERVLGMTEDEGSRFGAYNLLGISIFRDGNVGEKKLAEAEEALRRAVELGGGAATASRYTLARTLRALGRQGEAMALSRNLLEETSPDHPIADRARVLYCHLRRDMAEEAVGGASAPSPLGDHEDTIDLAHPREPVQVAGDVQKPVKIHAPGPRYPVDPKRGHVQGEVVLDVVISKEGCVTNLEVVEGLSPLLDRAAEEAISGWVFRPATLDGEALSVYYTLKIRFRFREETRVIVG